MNDTKTRIGVLVSGNGSNLQAIIDAAAAERIPAEVVVVIASKPGVFALARARKAGIEAICIDSKEVPDPVRYSERIAHNLVSFDVGLVCLAGFLKKIEQPLLEQFPGRILNIHPALLPKFGGKGMYGHRVHEAVIEAGEKESGPSVHFVDDRFDHGPVILQRAVPVLPNDTADTLAERVLIEEHTVYPEAIRLVCEGKVRFVDGQLIKK